MKYDLEQFKDRKVIIEINGNQDLLQACREYLGSSPRSYEGAVCISLEYGRYDGWVSETSPRGLKHIKKEYYDNSFEIIPLSFWEEQEESSQTLNDYTQQAYGNVNVEVTVKDSSEVEDLKLLKEKFETGYNITSKLLEEQRKFNKALGAENEELLRAKKSLTNSMTLQGAQLMSLQRKFDRLFEQFQKRNDKIETQKEQLQTLDQVILKRNKKIEELAGIIADKIPKEKSEEEIKQYWLLFTEE